MDHGKLVRVALFLAALFSAGGAYASLYEVYDTRGGSEPWLYLRAGPSTSHKILIRMNDGVLLEQIANADKWYQVKVMSGPGKGLSGFAHARWLQSVDVVSQRCIETELLSWSELTVEVAQNAIPHCIGAVEISESPRYRHLLARNYNKVGKLRLAKEHYSVAAEAGHAVAQNNLSYLLSSAQSATQADKDVSDMWLARAAANGEPNAQNAMGNKYYNGTNIDKDLKRAFEWYLASAWQGVATAQNTVGVHHYYGIGIDTDYGAAVEWFRRSATNGNRVGQRNLALAYSTGNGVQKDSSTAFQWNLRSAEGEDSDAQYIVAKAYQDGLGVEKDPVQALSWYKKAADQGQEDASQALASLTAEATRNEQTNTNVTDLKEASLHDLTYHAQAGNVDAQFWLGYRHDFGEGVTRDFVKAHEWYAKSAAQGHAGSHYYLGYLYLNGQGVERNYRVAFEWFHKAADLRLIDAQKVLAKSYYEAKYVSADYKESLKWHKILADNGHAYHQYEVGRYYQYGIAYYPDYDIAKRYYMLAVEQGFSGSAEAYNSLVEDDGGFLSNAAMATRYSIWRAEESANQLIDYAVEHKEEIAIATAVVVGAALLGNSIDDNSESNDVESGQGECFDPDGVCTEEQSDHHESMYDQVVGGIRSADSSVRQILCRESNYRRLFSGVGFEVLRFGTSMLISGDGELFGANESEVQVWIDRSELSDQLVSDGYCRRF